MIINTCENVLPEACYFLMQNLQWLSDLVVNAKAGNLLRWNNDWTFVS